MLTTHQVLHGSGWRRARSRSAPWIAVGSSAGHVVAQHDAHGTRPPSSFVVGFLLDAASVSRQIGYVHPHRARKAFAGINRLLDWLKQGLRRIGRGRSEVHTGEPAGRTINDRGHDSRLRSELDDAPSSLDTRLAPAAPPTAPQSGRTRKAILSKARRTAASQNALSFWGLAPVAPADESGHPTTLAPASMLAGSSLLQPSTAAAGARHDSPLGQLGAAIPFCERQEFAAPQALLEPAPPLSRQDDATDRPTWP